MENWVHLTCSLIPGRRRMMMNTMNLRSTIKKLFLAGAVLCLAGSLLAQDPQFTQFFANKLYLAPSFAGSTKQQRIVSMYRNQWAGIPGGFNTMSFSYEYFFPNFNSGLGVLVLRDMAGSGRLGMTNAGVLYSYDFQIFEEWHVRPGLHFLYSMYGIDFYRLRFYDQLVTGNGTTFEDPPAQENIGAFDASTSVLVYSKSVWAGAAVDHLFRPDQSFYANKAVVPMKFSFFGGFQIIRQGKLLKPIDETVSLAYLFRLQQNKKQLDIGLYWNKVPLVLGFWYRGIPPFNSERGDALAMLVGFKMKGLSIGYSYDFTISNLVSSTHGAHEISMSFDFQTNRKKKIHAIPCPEF